MHMKQNILIALILLCAASAAHASAAGKIREGNRWYKKGQFDKAVGAYREAQIAAPGNPYIDYNIGNALHRQQNFDEAAAAYSKALAVTDPAQKARAYYNLGNTAYRLQKTDEALNYYKKALEANPADVDAKYNIEFINAVKCGQCTPKDDPKKDGKNNKNDKDKRSGGQGDGKDKGRGEQQSEKKAGMSKEDAKRILQYYDSADKHAAKKRTMKTPQLPHTDEDW